MSAPEVQRRSFLKSGIIAGTALAAPAVVSSRVFGKDAPSNTLRIGCIGVGRMGSGDMRECLREGLKPSANARIVAVCDVDRHRAENAKRQAEKQYGEMLPDGPRQEIAIYDDFRDLLSQKDIDGVLVATPDHWHALVSIAAAEAGKDIHVQKPLTYTIDEGKKLIEAVRRNNVILQTGSQQRSDGTFRHACELVRNGRLGKLREIRVTLPPDSGTGRTETMPVPGNLNYDMWLGPTPVEDYTEDRVHPQANMQRPGWLQIEPYCRGMITGWGSHMFDIAQWAHGSDNTGPVEMQAVGEFPDRGLFNVHTNFQATGRYADGVRLIAQTGDPAGVKFLGDDGWLDVGRGRIDAEHPEILKEKLGDGDIRLYVSRNQKRNFLECMRSRKEPICPVEVGHRSNSICVITHLSMKLGRRLNWDPQAERFVGDDEANALLGCDYRAPWSL